MLKNVVAMCTTILLLPALAAREADPEPKTKPVQPREIVVAGLPQMRGRPDAPYSIASEKDLAGMIADREARAAILKRVDFRKERLLLFSWQGEVDDRLTPLAGNAGEANFEHAYTPSRRAVHYAKLFAVPARAKVKVTTKEK